jgi:CHAD domain-containing protein
MPIRELVFDPGARALPALLEGIAAAFPGHSSAARRENVLYLDTFDRRLQRRGGILTAGQAAGARLELRWQDARTSARRLVRELPIFAPDLPAGPLRRELGPLIAPRRLLPLVEIERDVRELRLADAEDRLTARVLVLERRARAAAGSDGEARGHPLPARILVRPVRGQAIVAARLAGFLAQEAGLARLGPRPPTGELEEALAACRLPLLSPQPPAVSLDPEQAAGAAVRAVLRRELQQMELQEDGMLRDLDQEFLHDWRVALRRTRTGLRQMKRVLPRPAVARFSDELRFLSAESGPLRDLDVFLADLALRLPELPRSERGALVALEAFARERRADLLAAFRATLSGPRVRAFLAEWRAFLEQAGPDEPDAAAEPVLRVVSRRLARRRRALLARGKRLEHGSPAAKLHALRIECKKLRYLLDLFRSLYRPADVEALTSAVRRFQVSLGEANDAVVEIELLEDLARGMLERGQASAATLLAIGRLQGRLERDRKRATRRFFERFQAFRRAPELELLPAAAPAVRERAASRARARP